MEKTPLEIKTIEVVGPPLYINGQEVKGVVLDSCKTKIDYTDFDLRLEPMLRMEYGKLKINSSD